MPIRKLMMIAAFAGVFSFGTAKGTPPDDAISAIATKRYEDALKILLPLANSGDDEAQRLIGEMCFNGQGMTANPVAAFKWTEIAAASGNKIAQYNLGYMYETGQGTARSIDQAIRVYKLSAAQQYVLAQRRLGDLFVDSNLDQALQWYNLARLNGDEQSRQVYSKLAGEQHDATARMQEKLREEDRRVADARNAQEIAEMNRRLAAADSNSGPGVADIITGQIKKNAAEARVMAGAVNGQAVIANTHTSASRKPLPVSNRGNKAGTESTERPMTSSSSSRSNASNDDTQALNKTTESSTTNLGARESTLSSKAVNTTTSSSSSAQTSTSSTRNSDSSDQTSSASRENTDGQSQNGSSRQSQNSGNSNIDTNSSNSATSANKANVGSGDSRFKRKTCQGQYVVSGSYLTLDKAKSIFQAQLNDAKQKRADFGRPWRFVSDTGMDCHGDYVCTTVVTYELTYDEDTWFGPNQATPCLTLGRRPASGLSK